VDIFLRLAAILIPFLDDWLQLQNDKKLCLSGTQLHANLHATCGHPVAICNRLATRNTEVGFLVNKMSQLTPLS
jgi:hypothetical protein